MRRLAAAVLAVLAVLGLAALPQLADPAAGAAFTTRAGTVLPSTLSAGATTRFCGAGFAAGAAVAVYVGTREARGLHAGSDGGFCLDLRADAAAAGPARLLAVGRAREGGLLKVTGGVAVTASHALRHAAGPISSTLGGTVGAGLPRSLLLQLWAAVAVLALAAGMVGIAAQRRRPVRAE